MDGGCVEKETNYHFNCVNITFRFVRAENFFPDLYFSYSWNGPALWKHLSVK